METINIKEYAIKNFNETWDLIDKTDRTPEDNAEMLRRAHVSRYLWGMVGEPKNFERGDWQVSHVYALLGFGEPALLYAELCKKTTLENEIGAFDSAFAYEAVARAYAVLGDIENSEINRKAGLEYAEKVEAEEDREYVKGELNSISIKTP